MRRKTKRIVILIVCILVIILLMVGMYFYGLTSVSTKSEKITFNIAPGTGTREVINDLFESKIIRSKVVSLIYVALHKNEIMIKAGSYELNRSDSTKKIFEILSKGSSSYDTLTLTFIEGKRITDYVKLISEHFPYEESEILETMQNRKFLENLIQRYSFLDEKILDENLYYPLEGYLFPATYEFYQDASIEAILTKMLDKSAKVLDNYSASIAESGKSIHEILTIASIVENESMYDEDRSLTSQVIYKRLSLDMSLGMDATASYGARKALKEKLTSSDLDALNAYNTRNLNFKGLPVGPICNPGEKSIAAALKPSATDYIYFVSDSKGKSHFTADYNEFLRFKELYS